MDGACVTLRESLTRRGKELGLEVIISGIGSVAGIAFTATQAARG